MELRAAGPLGRAARLAHVVRDIHDVDPEPDPFRDGFQTQGIVEIQGD